MQENDEKAAIHSLAQALTAAPAPIRGQWYYNQGLTVDGYTFADCRFDNCSLYTSTANFQFLNCVFSGCTYYFSGTALKAVKFFSIPDRMGIKAHALLQPIVASDGRVSITG